MKLLPIALAVALTLGGCASTADYKSYSDGQAAIEKAKYAAEEARFKAMSDIAASGDPSAKVAAVVALAMSSGGAGGGGHQAAQLKAPEPPGQTALAWASILVPSITQGYAIFSNTRLGMRQSDNSAAVAQSTNGAFLGMATQIQTAGSNGTAAVAQVAGAGNQALVQLGASSNTALAQLGTSSNTALTTVAASGTAALTTFATTANQSLVSVAGLIQAPAANITTTIGGNGVIGSGQYSTQANPYTLSGSGVIGAGTYRADTNTLSGTGTLGGGAYTGPVTPTTTTTTTTPAPVVVTPVVTTSPVVVTPVVVVSPATAASAP